MNVDKARLNSRKPGPLGTSTTERVLGKACGTKRKYETFGHGRTWTDGTEGTGMEDGT